MGNYFTSRGRRTWRALDRVNTGEFGCFLQHALHRKHSSYNHRCEVGICDARVYCLCLTFWVLFSTQVLVQSLTTAKSRRTYIHILSPSSLWRTLATKNRYSFYRMGWINPESEHTTEINFFCRWDSYPQTSIDKPGSYRWATTTSWAMHFPVRLW